MIDLIEIQNDYLYKLDNFLEENNNIKKFNYNYLKNNLDVLRKLDNIFSSLTMDDICDEYFDVNFISLLKTFNNFKELDVIDKDNYFTYSSVNTIYQYFDDIKHIEKIDKDDEDKMFIEYNKTHDIELKKKIIENNLWLVKFILTKDDYYKRFNVPVVDLIQYCNEELIKSVDNYDVNLGFRFSSYATNCMKFALMNYINKYETTIYIPKRKAVIMREYNYLVKNTDDIRSDEEFYTKNKIKSDDFKKLKNASVPCENLDEFSDSLESEYDTFDECSREVLKDELDKLLPEILDEKYIKALKYRFNNQMTLYEIADIMGCTSSYIGTLIKDGIKTLQDSKIVYTKLYDFYR